MSFLNQGKKKFKYKGRVGSSPGTFEVDPQSKAPAIHVIAYSKDEAIQKKNIGVDEIKGFLEKWPITWIEVDGLGSQEIILKLMEIFNIHPVAIEDVVNVHQRPKFEQYEDHNYLVLRMPHLVESKFNTEQLSVFFSNNFVLTIQEREEDCFQPIRERILKSKGKIRSAGTDYLTYAIVDTVVDSNFPIIEHFGDQLTVLEDSITENPKPSYLNELQKYKRELLNCRRVLWPTSEMLGSILRDNAKVISKETYMYVRDCMDHATRLVEIIETYREGVMDLHDLYHSLVSIKMNEIMKLLTIISTIFIPLTFIVGVYGMNFDTSAGPLSMPELKSPYGYLAIWVIIIICSLLMVVWFKKKKWI